MASNIDGTKPVTGTPTTQSVRDNFLAAKTEIEALQQAVAAIPAGADGASAYEIWLLNGGSGTEQDFLDSLVGPSGAGTGDMLASVYDPDADGKVLAAETADAVPWAGVTSKPATYPPDAHGHGITDIAGLVAALAEKATPTDITNAITALVDSSPAALDTLNELAAALGDDPNFATTITNALAAKAAADHNHTGTYEPADATLLKLAHVGVSVGFPNIPWNPQSANYTTVLADAGKGILHPAADTTARTWTIDASLAYLDGAAITLRNQHGAGAVTVTISGGTLRRVGAGTTGNFTLAADGVVTLVREGGEWAWNGVGAS